MEQHVVISFFWTKFYFCVNLFEAMLAQNIYWTSIVSIYFTLNKSNVCVNVQNFIHCLCRSLLLLLCVQHQSVHKHTYSHAFCFPFVCAVIRALCAMGASFHAKYTFQIVVCLCCLSIFFERWRVLSTIETCVYMACIQTKIGFICNEEAPISTIDIQHIYMYIYFTNGTNENYAILIFPHFMHSSQCCAYMISSVHNEFNSISFDFESEYVR